MALIRGTTPTIKFTFSEIDIQQIEAAILFIKQMDRTVIEKDISTATVNEFDISWTLSQSETLSLAPNVSAKILCDWKTAEGLRGRSEVFLTQVESSGKNEVI